MRPRPRPAGDGGDVTPARAKKAGQARPAFRMSLAGPEDAQAVANVRTAADAGLAVRYGRRPSVTSARGVLAEMKRARVYLARRRGEVIATLTLGTRKPWAIDLRYFPKRAHPLYLTSMAVLPGLQGEGIGRRCLEEALRLAREWPAGPADVIRLDAYDADYGAGGFYRSCGYREIAHASYRGTPLIYYEIDVPQP